MLINVSRLGKTLIVLLSLGFFILVMAPVTPAVQGISIHIDGKVIQTEVAPVIMSGRTMVPVRVISEELGCEVNWQQALRQVLISTPDYDGDNLALNAASGNGIKIIINGQEIKAGDEPAPYIFKDRTMVPLRVIAEGLGMEVEWDNDNRRVIITTPLPAEENAPIENTPADNPPIEQEVETSPPIMEGELKPSDDAIDYGLTIMGRADMGREELLALMAENNPAAPRELADLYLQMGEEYGIRGDVAFCQAAKETGWWKYGGLVEPYQNNYCGLGATGSAATGEEDLLGADPAQVRYEAGVHGAIFITPAAGVEAHIQHLYAYACKLSLPAGKTMIDPRFTRPARGIAPLWVELGGRWAVPGYDRAKYDDFAAAFAECDTYGHSILRDYYQKAVAIRGN